MVGNRLRIYQGPPEDRCGRAGEPARPAADMVTAPVGEILPWLAHAAVRRRAWLRDFEEDEITISRDLYEVILAYQAYQRPSA